MSNLVRAIVQRKPKADILFELTRRPLPTLTDKNSALLQLLIPGRENVTREQLNTLDDYAADIIELLLDNGAFIQSSYAESSYILSMRPWYIVGDTPLHLAARYGLHKTAAIILKHAAADKQDAVLEAKNQNGDVPFVCAQKANTRTNSNVRVTNLIEQYQKFQQAFAKFKTEFDKPEEKIDTETVRKALQKLTPLCTKEMAAIMPAAINSIGVWYFWNGTTPEKAFGLFEMTKDYSSRCHANLALCYLAGKGVKQNFYQAIAHFKSAQKTAESRSEMIKILQAIVNNEPLAAHFKTRLDYKIFFATKTAHLRPDDGKESKQNKDEWVIDETSKKAAREALNYIIYNPECAVLNIQETLDCWDGLSADEQNLPDNKITKAIFSVLKFFLANPELSLPLSADILTEVFKGASVAKAIVQDNPAFADYLMAVYKLKPLPALILFMKALVLAGNKRIGELLSEHYKKGGNDQERFEYHKLHALTGSPIGQAELGIAYAQGIGCRKDPCEAVRWFQLALQNKETLSGGLRQLVIKHLSAIASTDNATAEKFACGKKIALGFSWLALGPLDSGNKLSKLLFAREGGKITSQELEKALIKYAEDKAPAVAIFSRLELAKIRLDQGENLHDSKLLTEVLSILAALIVPSENKPFYNLTTYVQNGCFYRQKIFEMLEHLKAYIYRLEEAHELIQKVEWLENYLKMLQANDFAAIPQVQQQKLQAAQQEHKKLLVRKSKNDGDSKAESTFPAKTMDDIFALEAGVQQHRLILEHKATTEEVAESIGWLESSVAKSNHLATCLFLNSYFNKQTSVDVTRVKIYSLRAIATALSQPNNQMFDLARENLNNFLIQLPLSDVEQENDELLRCYKSAYIAAAVKEGFFEYYLDAEIQTHVYKSKPESKADSKSETTREEIERNRNKFSFVFAIPGFFIAQGEILVANKNYEQALLHFELAYKLCAKILNFAIARYESDLRTYAFGRISYFSMLNKKFAINSNENPIFKSLVDRAGECVVEARDLSISVLGEQKRASESLNSLSKISKLENELESRWNIDNRTAELWDYFENLQLESCGIRLAFIIIEAHQDKDNRRRALVGIMKMIAKYPNSWSSHQREINGILNKNATVPALVNLVNEVNEFAVWRLKHKTEVAINSNVWILAYLKMEKANIGSKRSIQNEESKSLNVESERCANEIIEALCNKNTIDKRAFQDLQDEADNAIATNLLNHKTIVKISNEFAKSEEQQKQKVPLVSVQPKVGLITDEMVLPETKGKTKESKSSRQTNEEYELYLLTLERSFKEAKSALLTIYTPAEISSLEENTAEISKHFAVVYQLIAKALNNNIVEKLANYFVQALEIALAEQDEKLFPLAAIHLISLITLCRHSWNKVAPICQKVLSTVINTEGFFKFYFNKEVQSFKNKSSTESKREMKASAPLGEVYIERLRWPAIYYFKQANAALENRSGSDNKFVVKQITVAIRVLLKIFTEALSHDLHELVGSGLSEYLEIMRMAAQVDKAIVEEVQAKIESSFIVMIHNATRSQNKTGSILLHLLSNLPYVTKLVHAEAVGGLVINQLEKIQRPFKREEVQKALSVLPQQTTNQQAALQAVFCVMDLYAQGGDKIIIFPEVANALFAKNNISNEILYSVEFAGYLFAVSTSSAFSGLNGWVKSLACAGNVYLGKRLNEYYQNHSDIAARYEWYKMYALTGDKFAQTKLGEIYAKGNGCKQDWPEAVAWLGSDAENLAYSHPELLKMGGLVNTGIARYRISYEGTLAQDLALLAFYKHPSWYKFLSNTFAKSQETLEKKPYFLAFIALRNNRFAEAIGHFKKIENSPVRELAIIAHLQLSKIARDQIAPDLMASYGYLEQIIKLLEPIKQINELGEVIELAPSLYFQQETLAAIQAIRKLTKPDNQQLLAKLAWAEGHIRLQQLALVATRPEMQIQYYEAVKQCYLALPAVAQKGDAKTETKVETKETVAGNNEYQEKARINYIEAIVQQVNLKLAHGAKEYIDTKDIALLTAEAENKNHLNCCLALLTYFAEEPAKHFAKLVKYLALVLKIAKTKDKNLRADIYTRIRPALMQLAEYHEKHKKSSEAEVEDLVVIIMDEELFDFYLATSQDKPESKAESKDRADSGMDGSASEKQPEEKLSANSYLQGIPYYTLSVYLSLEDKQKMSLLQQGFKYALKYADFLISCKNNSGEIIAKALDTINSLKQGHDRIRLQLKDSPETCKAIECVLSKLDNLRDEILHYKAFIPGISSIKIDLQDLWERFEISQLPYCAFSDFKKVVNAELAKSNPAVALIGLMKLLAKYPSVPGVAHYIDYVITNIPDQKEYAKFIYTVRNFRDWCCNNKALETNETNYWIIFYVTQTKKFLTEKPQDGAFAQIMTALRSTGLDEEKVTTIQRYVDYNISQEGEVAETKKAELFAPKKAVVTGSGAGVGSAPAPSVEVAPPWGSWWSTATPAADSVESSMSESREMGSFRGATAGDAGSLDDDMRAIYSPGGS